MAEKNVFRLARDRRAGDENQMIELLAYLWQEVPELVPAWLDAVQPKLAPPGPWLIETQFVIPSGRRPDLKLEKPGEALVLVEVKLGAEAGELQLEDYADYLASHERVSTRGLVFLTQKVQADFSAETRRRASDDVWLCRARWQDMSELLAESDSRLAEQFREMLVDEGLVKPAPFTHSDWTAWGSGAVVANRIRELLDEARPRLELVLPRHLKTNQLSFSATYIYRTHVFDGVSLMIGFNPGAHRGHPANLDVMAMNTSLSQEDQRAEADRVLSTGVCTWKFWDHLGIARPLAEVLTADTFDGQIEQLLEHVSWCLSRYREVRYLPHADAA